VGLTLYMIKYLLSAILRYVVLKVYQSRPIEVTWIKDGHTRFVQMFVVLFRSATSAGHHVKINVQLPVY